MRRLLGAAALATCAGALAGCGAGDDFTAVDACLGAVDPGAPRAQAAWLVGDGHTAGLLRGEDEDALSVDDTVAWRGLALAVDGPVVSGCRTDELRITVSGDNTADRVDAPGEPAWRLDLRRSVDGTRTITLRAGDDTLALTAVDCLEIQRGESCLPWP